VTTGISESPKAGSPRTPYPIPGIGKSSEKHQKRTDSDPGVCTLARGVHMDGLQERSKLTQPFFHFSFARLNKSSLVRLTESCSQIGGSETKMRTCSLTRPAPSVAARGFFLRAIHPTPTPCAHVSAQPSSLKTIRSGTLLRAPEQYRDTREQTHSSDAAQETCGRLTAEKRSRFHRHQRLAPSAYGWKRYDIHTALTKAIVKM